MEIIELQNIFKGVALFFGAVGIISILRFEFKKRACLRVDELPKNRQCAVSNNFLGDSEAKITELSKYFIERAESSQIYLDESRSALIRRTVRNLVELVQGKKLKKNRFRELLLGCKSVGKSTVLKFLEKTIIEFFPDSLLVIYVDYGLRKPTITDLILSEICQRKTVSATKEAELNDIRKEKDLQKRTDALERYLESSDFFVFLLLDEFHLVYNVVEGNSIVPDVMFWSGSNQGRVHMIVSGSSTNLRKLAFARLPAGDSEVKKKYPGYTGTDLNSTKLQPHWIFPVTTIKQFEDFIKLCPSRNTLFEAIMYSGGRPGLLIDNPGESLTLAYSLAKNYSDSNSVQRDILRCLVTVVEMVMPPNTDSKNSETESSASTKSEINQIDLHTLTSFLRPVTVSQLEQCIRSSFPSYLNNQSLSDYLFDLADDGIIIYNDSGLNPSTVSFASVYAFFKIQTSMTTLSWKEAAALKMPSGLFHELAESVAFRYLRQYSQHWLGFKLKGHEATSFECSTASISGKVSTYNLMSNPSDFASLLHKELLNGKDTAGADGIVFIHCKNGFDIFRVQLKLGQKSYTAQEIDEIKKDMETRGNLVLGQIKSKFNVNKVVNCLVTTRHPMEQSNDENFKIFGPKELAKVWPNEVKDLGHPYGSNRNLLNYLGKETPHAVHESNCPIES